MESHKLAFKFFLKDATALNGQELVPVFHKWIQSHAVADHLAIDVADYAHVHEGPGTMLITLEANFALDKAGGEPGLLYVRKLPIAGADTFAARLAATLRYILEAAQRLENEPALDGKVKFRTDTFAFRIYDRLLAPNTVETFNAVKKDLQSLANRLYGLPVALQFTPSSESLFEVIIKIEKAPAIKEMLEQL